MGVLRKGAPAGVGLCVIYASRKTCLIMKKCKSCQSEIDDKAKKCPHCQTDQRNWFARHIILTILLGAVLILFLIALAGSAGGGGSTNTSTDTTLSETTQVTEEEADNVPAEYKSALRKADSYANMQHMSKKGLYGQLTSEYGEKFTPEAAQYAVDNVKADWNANALEKAKSYQELQHMSPAAIHDQLTSEYGEKFTVAEADYAIENLNK